MSTLEQILFSQLGSHAGLSDLVGARIYPDVAPRGVAKPYVVWQEISGMPMVDTDGSGGLTYYRVQISAWALSAASARAVMTQVLDAMNSAAGASPRTYRSLVVEPGVRSAGFEFDTKLHGKQCDFSVKFTPSTDPSADVLVTEAGSNITTEAGDQLQV